MIDPPARALADPLPPAPDAPPGPPARRRPVVVGAIAAVLALVAGALVFVVTQGGGSAEAQPLSLAFTEGRSETYAVHLSMNATVASELFGDLPMQMEVDEVFTWAVRSVDADGVATIDLTIDEMSGTVNGVAVPSGAADLPPVEIVVAPDGRVLSAGGLALGGAEQTQGFGFPGMGQLTPILPDQGVAVAPGDTWHKEFSQDFPFGDGTIGYTATSTYDRNETVNGREAAVILTDLDVPIDLRIDLRDLMRAIGDQLGGEGLGGLGASGPDALDGSIVYDGTGTISQTSWVDLGARELLRSESRGDFDLSMQFTGIPGFEGAMTFDGTYTQTLERR